MKITPLLPCSHCANLFGVDSIYSLTDLDSHASDNLFCSVLEKGGGRGPPFPREVWRNALSKRIFPQKFSNFFLVKIVISILKNHVLIGSMIAVLTRKCRYSVLQVCNFVRIQWKTADRRNLQHKNLFNFLCFVLLCFLHLLTLLKHPPWF